MRNHRYKWKIMSVAVLGLFIAAGCGGGSNSDSMKTVDEMFTERDISGAYDEKIVNVALADGSSKADDESAVVDGDTVKITGEGTYILSGSLSDGMVIVDADDSDKVQLVLDDVNITSMTSAPVYVKNAKKVFITLAESSGNVLTNGGSYVAIDENNIDAVIFAKDDITFNGSGSIVINAAAGHGVVSKDDIVIASGTYNVTSASHSFDGKDSIRVAGGTFNLKTDKDGFHAENKDDSEDGYIYVRDGDFTIAAGSDGISAAAQLRIDGGKINVTESYEGLEAKDIVINDGDIKITASDDGINAADGSASDDSVFDGKPFDDMPDDMPDNMPDDMNMPEEGGDGERSEPNANGGRPKRPDGTMPPDFEQNKEKFDKDFDGMKERGKGGHGGPGGGFGVQDASVTINGGTIVIDAEGDGIDSNGTLTVNDGCIYIAGPSRGGNGALDYGKEAVITGGCVIAAGDSGMAESFGEESTQASALVNVEEQSEGGDIILKDKSGNELIRWTTAKRFNSVVISCPQMQSGEKYTLVTGENNTEVSVEDNSETSTIMW